MPQHTGDLPGAEFARADLNGARFTRTRLNNAAFRMVDLSGAIIRDSDLTGVSIDGEELDGLLVNGVLVAPLVEAELTRREPARALRRASDPADLRTAWALLGQSWAASHERVAAMPAGTADISVAGEWSYTQTLRHLIFATEAWLGAILDNDRPFHPWGMPFSDVAAFVESVDVFGLDQDARPSLPEVLELRAVRFGQVAAFLAEATPERLAEELTEPEWGGGSQSVLRCLWVILNEECEHLRYAQRDLDLIEAGSPLAADHPS